MTEPIFEHPTTEEQPFLDAICANPADLSYRLVYADWLDEQEDPRAEWLRASIEIERGIEELGWGFAFRIWRPLARKLLAQDERLSAAFATCDACTKPIWTELPEALRRSTTGHWFCGGFVENVAIGRQGLEVFGDELRRRIPLRGVSSMSGLSGPEDLRQGGPAIWRGIERIVDNARRSNQGFAPFVSVARAREFAEATNEIRALATGPLFLAEGLAAFLNAKPIESLYLELHSADELERLLALWQPTNLRCLGLATPGADGQVFQSFAKVVGMLADWPGLRSLRLLHFPMANVDVVLATRSRNRPIAMRTCASPILSVPKRICLRERRRSFGWTLRPTGPRSGTAAPSPSMTEALTAATSISTDLLIRRLEPTDEAAFAEASAGWNDDSGFMWTRPAEGQSFADWVEGLRREEAGIELRPGRVPATVLAGFVDGKLVARASIRHRLNEVIATVGGNIGYAVVAPYRRRGFATRMLIASLDELRRLGVARALVTCNVDNEGSRRTIEKCGGVFQDVYVPETGPARRRYWIEV